jgi:hypothetical protein
MGRFPKHSVPFLGLLFILSSVGAGLVLLSADGRQEILRTTERELKVKIESAFGKLYVFKGDGKKVCTIDIKEKEGSKPKGKIDYRAEGDVGVLNLKLDKWGGSEDEDGEKNRLDLHDLEPGKWYLGFTDAIPISFNVELAVGKGEFDCSGLLVKDFKLSTGASSVVLRFPEPNKAMIENMKIESGVGKFVGESLGNANFRRLDFSGGVGSYTLDFTGKVRDDAEIRVEVGVGTLTIIVPKNVGARIEAQESWISKIELDRDFQKKKSGEYFSENYSSASSRMRISVESALGLVKVRRGQAYGLVEE